MNEPIKILLADYQFLTRQGIANLIRQTAGLELVGEIDSHDQLNANLASASPDIVVYDHSLTQMPLENLLKQVRSISRAKLLIVTNDLPAAQAKAAIVAGVDGFLTKDCDEDEILDAFHDLAKGKNFFCNKIIQEVVLADQRNDSPEKLLTRRELEVLKQVAQGKTTSHIADTLFISVHTVNAHRKKILKKLSLSNPAEMVAYAINNKLI